MDVVWFRKDDQRYCRSPLIVGASYVSSPTCHQAVTGHTYVSYPHLNKYHRNLSLKSEGNTNLHLAFHATSLQYLRYLIVFNKLPQV